MELISHNLKFNMSWFVMYVRPWVFLTTYCIVDLSSLLSKITNIVSCRFIEIHLQFKDCFIIHAKQLYLSIFHNFYFGELFAFILENENLRILKLVPNSFRKAIYAMKPLEFVANLWLSIEPDSDQCYICNFRLIFLCKSGNI